MAGQALGQRGREVPHRPLVGQGLLPFGQLDGAGQGPGPDEAELGRTGVALDRLLQGVEVGGERGAGPLLVAPGPGHEAPGAGADLDVEAGQQGGGAPHRVGADAPGGQFGQEGQAGRVAELGGDDAGRLQRVGPRERAEPGGGARRPDVRHGPRP